MKIDVTIARATTDRANRVEPVSYGYRLSDRMGAEVLAYHWHPTGLSAVLHPHLHLSSRLSALELDDEGTSFSFSELHIPIGPVSIADVVGFLIAEVGVEPRRADWGQILAAGGA